MPNSVLWVLQNTKIDFGFLLIVPKKNWVFHTITQIRAMQKNKMFYSEGVLHRKTNKRHLAKLLRTRLQELIKAPVLPGFADGTDNLDSYLLRFKRYATVAGW